MLGGSSAFQQECQAGVPPQLLDVSNIEVEQQFNHGEPGVSNGYHGISAKKNAIRSNAPENSALEGRSALKEVIL